jgi:ABC-type Na+ transport system ATPase subunit NatA
MSAVIDVKDLYKRFGDVHALNGLDLQVREGEIHGFLGPNGSGKTTTIPILLGVLRATSGYVRLLGGDPWHDAVLLPRKIAYVPEDVTLWPSLTGGETIDLLARMRGGINEERRTELIERFDLDPRKRARTYSKGQPAESRLDFGLVIECRAVLARRAQLGIGPANRARVHNGRMVERSITGEHLIAELDRLAAERGAFPAVLRRDNGPELACSAMAEWAASQVGPHFIPAGEPWRNGYI